MCIIIDNNVAARVLCGTADPNFSRLQQRLFSQKGGIRLVHGGRLTQELEKNNDVCRVLRTLDRAGRAIVVDPRRLADELAAVSRSGLCVSNDHHIIALARVSAVRLLCSLDQPLAEDFRNRKLLKEPRGRVYKTDAKHEHLLEACR